MPYIDMDALRESSLRLHRTITRHTGCATSGVVDVDSNRLPEFTRGELTGWLNGQKVAQSSASSAPAVQPEPPAPVQQPVEPPKVAEPLPPQIDIEKEFQADLKRAVDQKQGLDRLQQYVVEQGLAEDPANAAAIQQWLDENVKGYWSAQGVDLAIQWLGPRSKNVLKWAPKAAPPPPPPAAPTEILEPWQLPLDADEAMMKRASVRALKDLIERRRAASNQKYIRKGHAARF